MLRKKSPTRKPHERHGCAAGASSIDALVEAYLRVLANERGASTHTLRAYQRELRGFAAWLGRTQRRAGRHSGRLEY